MRERIHANISPEFVEYIVNPKSGPIMFRDFRLMMEINKAHAIMLCEEKILTAIFTIFSTMFLGFSIFYIIYITLKITGISDKLKKIKDPRKT